MVHAVVITGRYWRMKFASEAGDITGPARSPEGRAHYDGQLALYLSATPEGCIVASKRYMQPNDPPRAIFPLHVENARVLDLRDDTACAAHGIDPAKRSIEWQTLRAAGLRSPTWDISDKVRDLGLDGMLYASRSDPAKTHLTLFRWNLPDHAQVTPDGPALPYDLANETLVASAPHPKKSDS